jgi:hypothetical protein
MLACRARAISIDDAKTRVTFFIIECETGRKWWLPSGPFAFLKRNDARAIHRAGVVR